MRMLKFVAAFGLLTTWVVSTNAAPVTYACSLVDGQGQPGMYDQVDQMVLDAKAKLIDLRVAKTMGTSTPVNWIFTNRTGYDGSPEQIVMSEGNDGQIIAAGLDAGGSYSFKFINGYLLFGATYLAPAVAYTWQCAK